ncbi:MAG: Holliday junction resolvase RuvX [Chloroflexi bacterium]|nr:Holliday junction resolvase RuvX [Chloroflexota bacterium]
MNEASAGRLLGIDHGRTRIGLAICDALGLVARPLWVWRRRSRREDFAHLSEIIVAEQVVGAVLGIPSSDTAEPHPAAASIRNWASRFVAACQIPCLLWDETLTSQEATALARREGRPVGEPVDDWAAQVILQSYLDARRAGVAPALPSRIVVSG